MFNVGLCYMQGNGVDVSIEEGLKRYEKAAIRGVGDACNNLGSYYYRNNDYRNAYEWYYKGAKNKDLFCGLNVGSCYYEGVGVKQSYKKAAKWFKKVARKGNVNGQYNLGGCYLEGKGVKKSYEKAKYWLTTALLNENNTHEEFKQDIIDNLKELEKKQNAGYY